jgi:hypothetical protein
MYGVGQPSDTTNLTNRTIYKYKWIWRDLIHIMESYPNKFFVIWTGAPNVEAETSPNSALWAHQFYKWAKDTLASGLDATYGAFPPNVYVFDFFHKLINENYYLRPEYADAPNDAHPNAAASNLIAPQLVQEIFDAAIAYESIVPVELISFSASNTSNHVELKWQTASELNNIGFEIQRSSENSQWQRIGFVQGNGTSANVNNYSFSDPVTYFNGKYYYRLKQIDNDGTYEFSSIIEVDFGVPLKSELYQNYPNPFNPNTEINFNLAASGNVTLKIYNSLGSEVATLVDGFMNSGMHSLIFNAKDSSSGIYFYRLKTDNFSSARKMLLIK